MHRRFTTAIALAAVLTLFGAACSSNQGDGSAGGGGTPTAGGGANTVSATEKDFAIALNPTSGSAGSVTFNIHNAGPSVHEFVVFDTDLAEDQLPTTDEGVVDEEGEGLTLVDEQEDIAPNADATLTVDLDAGSYVIICNIPGHYSQGMHTSFTVS